MNKFRYYFYLRRLNLIKTLYFNFRVFPFRTALRLPVFVYGKVTFEKLHRGCVKLNHNCHSHSVHLGGGFYTLMFGRSILYRSYFRLEGTLVCGEDVYLDQGSVISVCKGATLHIGSNVRTNRNIRIHCKKSIIIEDNCRIGWDCQLLDTNFHYTLHDGRIANPTKEVFIGHNSWIANGTYIMKGSLLPPYSVIASRSLVNKDLSSYGEKSLFGGVPVHFITKDVRRLLNKESFLTSLFEDGKEYVDYSQIEEIMSL